jgi:hypothetical protein
MQGKLKVYVFVTLGWGRSVGIIGSAGEECSVVKCEVFSDLRQKLCELHKRGVLHGGIEARNMLVNGDRGMWMGLWGCKVGATKEELEMEEDCFGYFVKHYRPTMV